MECRLPTSSSSNKYNLFLLSLKCFEGTKIKKKSLPLGLNKRARSPPTADDHVKAREVKMSQRLASSRRQALLSPGDTPFLGEGCSATHRCPWEVPCALRPTDTAPPRCTSPKSLKDFKKVLWNWRSQTSWHKGVRCPGYTALPAGKDLFSTGPLLQLPTPDCHYSGLQKTGAQVLSMENHGFLDKHHLGIWFLNYRTP